MMLNQPNFNRRQTDRLRRNVFETLDHVNRILEVEDERVDVGELHDIKSKLYVTIERIGMKAERMIYSQRLLRELFSIINARPDMSDHEKQAALQILEELCRRYQNDLT